MNKFFKSGIALLTGLLAAFGTTAQEAVPVQQLPQMPVDSAVIVGQLPNGLSYYIRHNETPKGQADFYIAQKVGSILEEDNQRGLAHFLEHMCFNGTEHFPGKGIINYLESIGVKFGYNLNAYTSIDETVYNISSVPVARQSVQDSCLLILHDWSCALTLAPEEIDAERGVIHEEWRRSMVGQMRILENLLPEVYPDNKYGHRLPIGTMDVVDNFPPQAIIDYYHTWYRPDQQAIVVVGDIDPVYIQNKIIEMFSPIPMPENAKERYYVPVEDTPGTIVAIGSDPEMSASVALMFFKTDEIIPREYRNTAMFYGINFATSMVCDMLNTRLSDLAKSPDAPYAQAYAEIDNFFLASTKDALTVQVIGKGDNLVEGVQAAYREILRALRGGFTAGEYERAAAELTSRYERLYEQRNNTENESYAREYVRSFIDNDPIPGIAVEKQIYDMLAMQMNAPAISTVLQELVTDNNRVVVLMLPEAQGITVPTKEQVLEALNAVDGEEIEAYLDEVRTDPLIPALPAPGTITAEKHNDEWDATEFTLSNGVKVIVKPTDFKENEIVFGAAARGGYSVVDAADAPTLVFLPYAMGNHGLGEYSNSDLEKYLQGKQVGININIDAFNRHISGSTVKKDLPTLMELIYAYFTEYNFTADEFIASQNMFKGVLANQESTPDFKFQQLVMNAIYAAPAEQLITTAIIDQASREKAIEIMHAMLANPTDFTFAFTGNIDLDTFKPLMEQYLATLPVGGASIKYAPDAAFECATGKKTIEESMAMTTPQTWVCYAISGHENYTVKERAMTSMISQIMSKRLLDKVREEMGATYSIGAAGQLSRLGDNNLMVQIPFPMKPEMREEVLAAVNTIIKEVGTNITADELNPIIEFMVKENISALKENKDWNNAILGSVLNGVNILVGADEVYRTVTPEDLMAFWNKVLAQGNLTVVMLDPAK